MSQGRTDEWRAGSGELQAVRGGLPHKACQHGPASTEAPLQWQWVAAFSKGLTASLDDRIELTSCAHIDYESSLLRPDCHFGHAPPITSARISDRDNACISLSWFLPASAGRRDSQSRRTKHLILGDCAFKDRVRGPRDWEQIERAHFGPDPRNGTSRTQLVLPVRLSACQPYNRNCDFRHKQLLPHKLGVSAGRSIQPDKNAASPDGLAGYGL
jgi:hypothetical protein